ncbi:MAG: type II toxin-antitoxin system HicB family antitoxin [Methylocella sp.]
MAHYVGILDGSGNNWGVRIPDVPGCVGAGNTPDEAIASVTSALRDVMAHKANGSFEIPTARSVGDVLTSIGLTQGGMPVLIPLLLESGRLVKVNLMIDAGLLETIDQEAARRKLSRSKFMASAARDKIEAQR